MEGLNRMELGAGVVVTVSVPEPDPLDEIESMTGVYNREQ